MVDLQQVLEARHRIKGYVRRTPVIEATPVKNKAGNDIRLFLKLECLQITGSFKARGAVNKLHSLTQEQVNRGLVTASGGNHGLGVAYAGWLAGVPTTVFLPSITAPIKAKKLESWGAKVIHEGTVWDDANKAALALAESAGLTYFHPFDDPFVVAGQGTTALEFLEDVPDLDVLLVAIGGGGLISGVSLTAKAMNPDLKIIGVEPVGAPTLRESLRAGQIVNLPEITTTVGTLAAKQTAPLNFEIIRQNVEEIVLVTDEEMVEGARWLWQEMNVAAEMSGAAAFAALLTGKVKTTPGQKIGVLVCGAGTDGIS